MIRSLAPFLVLSEAFKKSLSQSLVSNKIYMEFLEVNTSVSYQVWGKGLSENSASLLFNKKKSTFSFKAIKIWLAK